MSRGKAFNRFQREKRVRKWTKIVNESFKGTQPEHFKGGQEGIEKSKKHNINLLVNTPKPCSCALCGNKRKIEGKTLQEKKHLLKPISLCEDSNDE